jgi:GNAT superfamily N-acetyltransferase
MMLGKSAFNRDMEHTMFVLKDGDGRAIARAAAFVNHRWQAHQGEQAGFIGNLTFGDAVEAAAVKDLFEAAEDWLRGRGAIRSITPVDGTGIVGLGLLVADHDHTPMFPGRWHPPHWAGLIESCGYSSRYPLMTYEVDFASEQYQTVAQRAIDTAECSVRPIDKKRWKEEFALLTTMFNTAMAEEWEFNPYTNEEFLEVTGALKPIADPNTFLFAEVDGQPAGFCFGLPNLSPLMQSFRGKLGPVQIVKLLRGGRRPDRWGLIGVGVMPEHRGKHIGQTMAATLYRYLEKLGMRSAPYYWVNESNLGSRRLAESFGADGHTAYVAYDKQLSRTTTTSK